MDLVTACRVFVHVSDRGSFTLGAAAARVPQSVASRRIAALERHFGERLFDRSTRRAALTVFGRDMLPSARRLVQLAEAMEYSAERARLRPFGLAVPETCPVRQLALLDAAARAEGTVLDLRAAGPAERAELLRSHDVRAAVLAVPPGDADWRVPLGVAFRADGVDGPDGADGAGGAGGGGAPPRPLRLETLRPGRTRRALRCVRIQPEDDVPHVRDRLEQLGHRAALVPAQIAVAASLVAAASETLRTGGFLLCSAPQAAELGLRWRPLAGEPVARGYVLAALTGDDAARVRDRLAARLAPALGAASDGGASDGGASDGGAAGRSRARGAAASRAAASTGNAEEAGSAGEDGG